MRTLQEKYNGVLEGKFSKTQFKRDAAIEMPQFVSTVNSFDDTVSILKNKGAITEAKTEEPKYSTASPADTIAPDVLDTGIKFELDKKHGTLDVTPEQYAKCREMAIKNLAKDVLYYVKQDSIQLEEPGEQMEKAKLNEGMSKEEAWKKFQEERGVTDKTIKVAREDFEKEWANRADEAIQNIENDEHTVKRIAKLTNQLLQDVDPRDEVVKAYAISVKNDLESGDASRLKRYKDVVSLDDLKDDMEHYISHDVDQLEESQYSISDIQSKFPDKAFDIQQTALRAVGATDVEAAYNKSAGEFEQALYRAAHGNLGEDLSEPDAEDLYQHDDEYLGTLKQRKALKEMFKKIIVNLINE